MFFFFFNWRLITLQYCNCFHHTLTWISHGCTLSYPPLHPIPQGHPSAPVLSALSQASNLDWWSSSHMGIYMFQCYSLKSSHPRLLPQSPKVCSLHLCLFCCLTYRVIITIFLSILAWRIPWTEEPGGLQSIGSHSVGHNWSNLAHMHSPCTSDLELLKSFSFLSMNYTYRSFKQYYFCSTLLPVRAWRSVKSKLLILLLHPLHSPPRTAYGELERDRGRRQERREDGNAGSEDSGLPKGQRYLALTSSQQQGVTDRAKVLKE